MKQHHQRGVGLACGALMLVVIGVGSGGPRPVFAVEKPIATEVVYKEVRLLRAEVSAAHLDSLVLLLEKTQNDMDSPSGSVTLLDEQITEKERELQAPSTPAALEKLQKELQGLKDDRAESSLKLAKLKQQEDEIKAAIERERQKLRQLTSQLSKENEALPAPNAE